MSSIERMAQCWTLVVVAIIAAMFALGWAWTTYLVPTDSDLQQWADVSECVNEATDRAGQLTPAEVEIVWARCQGRR